MCLLDNGSAGYIWKEEWNIPYESLWGRMEKFRAVNVLDPGQIDKIICIGADSLYTVFCPHLLIYRKQTYYIKQMHSFLQIDNELFANFTHLDGLFDNRLRYCPKCMSTGYHSFLHQLCFLDECFIHQKTRLLYRCSCSNTYILKRKRILNIHAFQCEQCNKKIDVAPSISDGIINLWRKSSIYKHMQKNETYKNIHIVDVMQLLQEENTIFRSYTEFNAIQKAALKDMLLTGKTNQKPRLIITPNSSEQVQKIIISEELNRYVLNKYEHDVILKHYWHIGDRFYRYEIDNHNIELLTIFFLIKELQCKNYIDQLKYGLRRNAEGKIEKSFYSDHKSSDMVYLIRELFFQLDINTEDYMELYNTILKEIVLARYKHIYSCFCNNYPSEYPCTSSSFVSYNNWNYPVYVIIKTITDDILLY